METTRDQQLQAGLKQKYIDKKGDHFFRDKDLQQRYNDVSKIGMQVETIKDKMGRFSAASVDKGIDADNTAHVERMIDEGIDLIDKFLYVYLAGDIEPLG